MNLPNGPDRPDFDPFNTPDPAFRSAVWRCLVALYLGAFVLLAIAGKVWAWW